jgi:hypothetical protein
MNAELISAEKERDVAQCTVPMGYFLISNYSTEKKLTGLEAV